MICPRCGIENEKKRNFCKSCGNPLDSNVVEPIDFGKTQALPVVVKPIEPMSKEEELKNTSVIPVISEEAIKEELTPEEDEETKNMEAIRDELIYTSEMEQVKVNIKQLESVKKPRKKRPVALIVIIILLFLFCALGVTYYLYKKDKLCFVKREEPTTKETTTKLDVKLDTEIKAIKNEIILNSTSHTLKYSYEITKVNETYKPVLKVYLDEVVISDPIIQDNSYKLADLYDEVINLNIYTTEDKVIKGTDKDYYYINIFVNDKYYVYIINDHSCIYKNVTNMFTTKDSEDIYNNKSSLIKNGQYAYIKEYDDESAIEQLSTISDDIVSFEDGDIIKGNWK